MYKLSNISKKTKRVSVFSPGKNYSILANISSLFLLGTLFIKLLLR